MPDLSQEHARDMDVDQWQSRDPETEHFMRLIAINYLFKKRPLACSRTLEIHMFA